MKKTKICILMYMLSLSFIYLFSLTTASIHGSEDKDIIFLKYEYFSELKIITVCLCCEDGSKFSGLLVGIEYDPDVFAFNSVERGSAKPKYEFTCSLKDNGVIAVLFDGIEPDFDGGVLASFSFGIKDAEFEYFDNYDFDIVFFDDTPAFYIDKNIIFPIEVEKRGCTVYLPDIENVIECLGFLKSKKDDGKVLIIGNSDVGKTVGFDLYIADLNHGRMTFIDCLSECVLNDKLFYNHYNIENLKQGMYLLPMEIKCDGLICIYILPYICTGDGKIYGVQKAFVFKNKEFIG